jgi:hypothetical protein
VHPQKKEKKLWSWDHIGSMGDIMAYSLAKEPEEWYRWRGDVVSSSNLPFGISSGDDRIAVILRDGTITSDVVRKFRWSHEKKGGYRYEKDIIAYMIPQSPGPSGQETSKMIDELWTSWHGESVNGPPGLDSDTPIMVKLRYDNRPNKRAVKPLCSWDWDHEPDGPHYAFDIVAYRVMGDKTTSNLSDTLVCEKTGPNKLDVKPLLSGITDDLWTSWHGEDDDGPPGLDRDTPVMVKLRHDTRSDKLAVRSACAWAWGHQNISWDIIAYRVMNDKTTDEVQEPAEPHYDSVRYTKDYKLASFMVQYANKGIHPTEPTEPTPTETDMFESIRNLALSTTEDTDGLLPPDTTESTFASALKEALDKEAAEAQAAAAQEVVTVLRRARELRQRRAKEVRHLKSLIKETKEAGDRLAAMEAYGHDSNNWMPMLKELDIRMELVSQEEHELADTEEWKNYLK